MKLSEELKARGLLQDTTPGIEKILDEEKPPFYLGVDPTATSLHLGNLLTYITARRLAEAGLRPILIVGGGTGRIGDPKPDAERPLIDEETLEKRTKLLIKQVKSLMPFSNLTVVDNYTWLKNWNLIDFLRDIGKAFTVNNLIRKEAIAQRLKSDVGLSYTEFAYPLLQATDYLELYRREGCRLQIGGSDQWGNIVAGIDLIRKKEGVVVHGFTIPLLIDKATGKKFGKSEGNAVWLDPEQTSPYQFYQVLINMSDEMAPELLYKLTLLPLSELEALIKEGQKAPEKRLLQKTLAFEVTKYVHGDSTALAVRKVSEILFGAGFSQLSKEEKEILIKEAPSAPWEEVKDLDIVSLLVKVGLASSKREARTFLTAGAVKVHHRKLGLEDALCSEDFIDGIALLKRGKKYLFVLYK